MKTFAFSAALLAGGESRRMGRDKAALVLAGEPLWRRQLATLRACGASELLIAGRADGPYVGGECDARAVVDDVPECGPLGGIATALRVAAHEWLLVLAVDLPAMTPAFLRALVTDAARAGRAIVPEIDGRAEPLAAIYPRAALAPAQRRLAAGELALHAWVAELRESGLAQMRAVAREDAALFQNLNTPADVSRGEGAAGTSCDGGVAATG